MSNPSSTPPAVNGPWRVLILDRDPADPKWILATVAAPGDVRPAWASELVDGEVPELAQAWAAARHGLGQVALTPLRGALAWRVDE